MSEGKNTEILEASSRSYFTIVTQQVSTPIIYQKFNTFMPQISLLFIYFKEKTVTVIAIRAKRCFRVPLITEKLFKFNNVYIEQKK